MKKLPGEVYFFVVLWALFAPALVVYFIAKLKYVELEHIDFASVANFNFVWPIPAAILLTILLMLELASYFKFKLGFFSAWHAVAMNTLEK
ncbi:hypothetical protein [Rhizobium vallis]|uniref:hypothetical protein n=1 Tax=Rhizobium vallis TaxID=634290 RepID=UPI000F867477|nr:hypothetical protein [Rhizobium vallis]